MRSRKTKSKHEPSYWVLTVLIQNWKESPLRGTNASLECWNSSSIIDWHHNSVSSTINTWPLVRSINVQVSYRGYCGLHGLYLGHLKLSPPPQPIAWKPNTIATRTLHSQSRPFPVAPYFALISCWGSCYWTFWSLFYNAWFKIDHYKVTPLTPLFLNWF